MSRISFLMAAACLTAAPGIELHAQRYPWNDRVLPSITANVGLDSASGDFEYRYTVANAAGAEQRINILRLTTAVSASFVAAPANWAFMYEPGLPQVLWHADGPLHPQWQPLHDADIASFASEIDPGESLSGFIVRSPCAAAPVAFIASGYNHMRTMEEDTLPNVPVPEKDEEGIRGRVLGPGDCNAVLEWGNRRPATDGFMGLVNFASGAMLPAGAVAIQIRFSRAGEQVDRATFRAEINQQDVTAAFRVNSRGDLVTVFQPGASPVQTGRNVLLISVNGVIPGSTRTATDADRITFTVP